MPNEKINKRRPYYDTGPIPYESLLKDEQQTIVEICDLLMDIKQSAEHRSLEARDRDNSTSSVWGTATPKLNNVILLDGERGVGKTSLMLTLINALSNPHDWNKEESHDNYNLPGGIDKAVRVMRQIDFDPLPPDLPIYSWIVQAFYPLVNDSIPDKPVSFFEDDSLGENNDSIAVLYQNLHRAATVGWTTGLLKNQLGKDAAEFLMWQQEQQTDWQRLQNLWHKFIDRLLHNLENSDHCDRCPLPQNCLIVLPIDDLDLQVTRTRELLLALRVLRHNRLVYLLTGYADNTDLALTASFYRDFIDQTSDWNAGNLDEIWENSTKLGRPLRDKTIPSSQIFEIKRINIKDALDWIPPVHKIHQGQKNTENLKTTLNNLRICNEEQSKLGDFLASRPPEERLSPKLIFRKLQGFSDKWSGQTDFSIDGVADFLKLALEDPLEKPLFVDVEQRAGSLFDRIIKLTGEFSQSAAVSENIEEIDEEDSRIKWFTHLDFYQKSDRGQATDDSDDIELYSIDSTSPNYLLAYDLACEYSKLIEIDRNIEFIGCPLSFIWTEYHRKEKTYFMPWPMVRIPDSPSEIFTRYRDWVTMLIRGLEHEGDISYEFLKNTWCEFNNIKDKNPIDDFKSVLDLLTYGDGQDSRMFLLELFELHAKINANTEPWRRITTPQVFELESENKVDYRDLVFRLRSPNTNESQHE